MSCMATENIEDLAIASCKKNVVHHVAVSPRYDLLWAYPVVTSKLWIRSFSVFFSDRDV
jgi:hypothetical protein